MRIDRDKYREMYQQMWPDPAPSNFRLTTSDPALAEWFRYTAGRVFEAFGKQWVATAHDYRSTGVGSSHDISFVEIVGAPSERDADKARIAFLEKRLEEVFP